MNKIYFFTIIKYASVQYENSNYENSLSSLCNMKARAFYFFNYCFISRIFQTVMVGIKMNFDC